MDKYVLIVAGGSGERMNAGLPKQFMEINGRPVLMHTFDAFSFLLPEIHFILVLQPDFYDTWEMLCKAHQFSIQHHIEEAGPKRFHSVKSGLKTVPDGVVVAIHDGARPLVSRQTILNCFEMAEKKGNAVPVIPMNESVRRVDHQFNRAIHREELRIVQTPQVFHSSLIKKAYRQNYNESFTDDATVLESIGESIHLVEGNPENIKLTGPQDLILAETLIQSGFTAIHS